MRNHRLSAMPDAAALAHEVARKELLHTDPSPAEHNDDDDAVAIIADALRTKFGAMALDVAQRQHGHALPESAATWSQIVSRLSA